MTFDDAVKTLQSKGYVEIDTSGGDEWNRHIAQRLSRIAKRPVRVKEVDVPIQYASGGTIVTSYRQGGRYRFEFEDLNTNKQASVLLDQEND